MITSPNRLARQAMARAQQSPTTAQMNAAIATAGVTAIRLTATLGAGGAVTLTFPAPYVSPPTVALTGKRNKGTLLLSDGPNEAATSGDVVEVLVIGRPA